VAAFDPGLNGTFVQEQKLLEIVLAAKQRRAPEASGIYLSDCRITEAAAFATDATMADRLWHLSEDLVGQRFDLERQSRL
jgi:hypothetical protein